MRGAGLMGVVLMSVVLGVMFTVTQKRKSSKYREPELAAADGSP
jgi:hypothetical protein